MKRYLDILDELEKEDNNFDYNRLRLFIMEEINYKKLIDGLNKSELMKLKSIVNNIMNFEWKEYYYYIELPNNVYFSVLYPYAIYKTKLNSFEINGNVMKVIEPNNDIKYINDLDFIEIKGIDKGMDLTKKDWFYIISCYHYLFERLYNLSFNEDIYKNLKYNELKYYIKKRIDNELKDYTIRNDIENIKFINRYDYLNDSVNYFEDILINPGIQSDISNLNNTLKLYK